jgi:spore coat protein CotH
VRRILLILLLAPTAFSAVKFSKERDDFFGSDKIYLLQISQWDPKLSTPKTLSQIWQDVKFKGAQLDLYQMDASSPHACDVQGKKRIHHSEKFEIEPTGQSTQMAPKSSYKFKLKDESFLGMKALNLKGMWYDPSQMREALAWGLFRDTGVLSLAQTYVRLCIESEGVNTYFGLYSVIEHPDVTFVQRKFGPESLGNYYSANYKAEDLGPANLSYQSTYFIHPDVSQRSYQLKNFSENPANETYEDLAELIRVIHFKGDLEKVLDVPGFLKWAAVNSLLGGWDNYWCSPQNYALYNSNSLETPFFHWVPWDYDAVLGSNSLKWSNSNILDWEASTEGCGAMYNRVRSARAELPLINYALSNPQYRDYYLSFMKHTLENHFTEKRFSNEMKRIWKLIRPSVLLEETDGNSTGRKYTNAEIERHLSDEEYEINVLDTYYHIMRAVRERRTSALEQLSSFN